MLVHIANYATYGAVSAERDDPWITDFDDGEAMEILAVPQLAAVFTAFDDDDLAKLRKWVEDHVTDELGVARAEFEASVDHEVELTGRPHPLQWVDGGWINSVPPHDKLVAATAQHKLYHGDPVDNNLAALLVIQAVHVGVVLGFEVI